MIARIRCSVVGCAGENRDFESRVRPGGDGFGFILYGCGIEHAVETAEKLCRAVRDTRFEWSGMWVESSLGVGLVEMSPATIDPVAALRAADQACYRAKGERGGIRVYPGVAD